MLASNGSLFVFDLDLDLVLVHSLFYKGSLTLLAPYVRFYLGPSSVLRLQRRESLQNREIDALLWRWRQRWQQLLFEFGPRHRGKRPIVEPGDEKQYTAETKKQKNKEDPERISNESTAEGINEEIPDPKSRKELVLNLLSNCW